MLFRSRKPTRRTRAERGRIWQFEQLESRAMLSITPAGANVLVNDQVVREQTTRGASTAVALSDATRIVAFSGDGAGDDDGVYAKIYESDGDVALATFRVNTTVHGEQHSASVAAKGDGAFVVVWAGRGAGDKEGIYFQRYTAAGVKVGGETIVNATLGGVQREPAIAMASDGSFTIAWSGVGDGDQSGVFLRRFAADGTAAAGEVRVNTATANDQNLPSLAFDSAGNLIVAWTSRRQDGSDLGVYGQRYAAAGTTLGAEFRVNTTITRSQTSPVVAADSAGGFVVAWSSFAQDGDGWGIAGQRFGGDGAAVGAEFVINDVTAGQQQEPSIAIGASNSIIAAWQSLASNGTGWEVRVREFTSAAAAVSASTIVNTLSGANSGHQYFPTVGVRGTAALVVWAGNGTADHSGVYGQRSTIDPGTASNQAPVMAAIPLQTGVVGTPVNVTVTATDPNAGDTLTFTLDSTVGPVSSATITRIDNTSARVTFTPTSAGLSVRFRVVVTDNGSPVMTDSEVLVITGTATTTSASAAARDEALAAIS